MSLKAHGGEHPAIPITPGQQGLSQSLQEPERSTFTHATLTVRRDSHPAISPPRSTHPVADALTDAAGGSTVRRESFCLLRQRRHPRSRAFDRSPTLQKQKRRPTLGTTPSYRSQSSFRPCMNVDHALPITFTSGGTAGHLILAHLLGGYTGRIPQYFSASCAVTTSR
jgi:hypothetical protein